MLSLIRAHPIWALLLWFFTVGQAVAFVPVIATGRGLDLPAAPFVVASSAVGLLLPTIVVTWVVEGPGGLRVLLARATALRVGAGWYLLALVLVPLGVLLIGTALLGRPADTTAVTVGSAVLVGLLAQTVLGLVTSNLAEEVAWTGLVQARLQHRHGPLVAALVTAPLFALQHLSLAVANAGSGAGSLVVVLIVLAVPFRALIGWAYNRTGSLFLVGLVHAAGNAAAGGTGLGPGMLTQLYPDQSLGPLHIFTFAALGLGIAIVTRGRLGLPGRGSTTTTHAEALRTRHRPDSVAR